MGIESGRVFSRNGSQSELNFLTNIPTLNNNDNRDTIWNQLQGPVKIKSQNKGIINTYNIEKTDERKNLERVVVHKGIKDGKLTNYYKEKVFDNNIKTNYSYVGLLKKFQTKDYNGLRLESADFAYLTDLGVYPINRLWILRRFKEGDSVPDNLLDWKDGPYPISTIIGWVSPEETNFFGVDFNETWITQEDRIDQVLSKILEKEFGLKSASMVSVPGWSQGLLMGFLNKMELSNFAENEIPFGNPNVLQEGATRVSDPTNTTYGLKSGMNVTLKTNYEQKFIGDIDPGSAMLDIIRNLTLMGTSDVVYFASKDSTIFNDLREAAKQGNSIDAWWTFIKSVIEKFLEAITELIGDFKNKISGGGGDDTGNNNGEQADKTSVITNLMTDLGETILASTVAKWKWPLKGGLGVMTGENTTPWHLTIGNPNSPFVSLANIKVTKVNVDFNNELGFNDMPTKMDVKIDVDFGRNLGGQEIFAMFNNGYTRVYNKSGEFSSLAKIYKSTPSQDNKSGVNESKKVSTVKNKK